MLKSIIPLFAIIRQRIHVCLLAVMLSLAVTGFAETLKFEVDGVWYRTFSEEMMSKYDYPANGVEVSNPPTGTYMQESMTIPAKVTHDGVEYAVCSASYWYLGFNPNLREIRFEYPAKSLGMAVSNCPLLERVVLQPELETLGGFVNCPSLEEIEFPAGLKKIASESLRSCGLKRLVFPAGFEEVEFCSCQELQLESLEFNGVQWIMEEAFSNAGDNLKVIRFPETLRGIAYRAFADNNFDEIWFQDNPGGLAISLDYAAFWNTTVKRIYCNCRQVPSLYGPYHSHYGTEQPPYDPESGVAPTVFPFRCDAAGISTVDDLSKITLYVPEGCRDEYAAHHYWGRFTIEESDFQVGVDRTVADNGGFAARGGAGMVTLESDAPCDAALMTVAGRTVATVRLDAGAPCSISLAPGIYIATADGSSCKVVVR